MQQSLFDEPAESAGGRTSDDDQDSTRSSSDVADYIRRADQAERRERQSDRTLYAAATSYADRVAILRWAINAPAEKVPDGARSAAMECKARLDAMNRAHHTSDPSEPGYVGVREQAKEHPDAWPFDDELGEIPHSSTSQADYEGFLAVRFVQDWRHVIPTEVLEEAKTADPSFL
jgi:hypothetical protein